MEPAGSAFVSCSSWEKGLKYFNKDLRRAAGFSGSFIDESQQRLALVDQFPIAVEQIVFESDFHTWPVADRSNNPDFIVIQGGCIIARTVFKHGIIVPIASSSR